MFFPEIERHLCIFFGFGIIHFSNRSVLSAAPYIRAIKKFEFARRFISCCYDNELIAVNIS